MPEKDISISFNKWLHKEVFLKKLVSPVGLLMLSLFAIVSGFLASIDLFFIPVGIAAAIGGVIFVYTCLFKPYTGFYATTVFSVLVFYPNHLLGRDMIPLSTVMEILMLFVFIGTYIAPSQHYQKTGTLIKTIVSILLILYTIEQFLQLFNPIASLFKVWLPVFKRWLFYIIVYITAYRLIDTLQKVRYFFNFWMVASFGIALYGCFQQWFGYLPSEINFILSVPGRWELLFQGGQLRKFSFLSDVVAFGILAGTMALVTLLLAINEVNKKKRYLMLFGTVIMLLGMAYSGTRTTTVIVPAGIVMYGFLNIQSKQTLIMLFGTVMMVVFIMFAPIYTNNTLNRVRSSFDSKDESLNLRERNRHLIQPYLYVHPMGGGLGTTNGEGGLNFPGHPLANFPTDSGLLKIGLEYGWTGLVLWMLLNLCILYQSIHYYFKMKNKELKKYMGVIVCFMFPLIVTQYSQETIGQIPQGIFVFSLLSLSRRLMDLDLKYQEEPLVSLPQSDLP